MWSLLSLLLVLATVTAGNYPVLDVATTMRMLLVPVDTKVGSAIYRLRGTDSDFDYPLQFEFIGAGGDPVAHIETLPCSRNHSFCEANVILARSLELGRVYDLKLRVRDTHGDSTTVECTIRPTNSSTPIDTIFPHLPTLIVVPEDAKVGTELEYVIVRKNPKNTRHANLELRGSSNFDIKQTLASPETVNGTIVLKTQLDFEKQSMYTLSIFAMDAYTEPENDTRNLAGFVLAVAVQDVQDVPPIFTYVPPVTLLNNSLQEGDVVLTVHAEDGDKGSPREIRYGLVSEGNPFMPYFHIDDKTGGLSLAKPLKKLRFITQPHQPILLTIIAEEVKKGLYEPDALSSTVQLALIMGELDNSPPYFDHDYYIARMDENSPQGTALLFNDPYLAEIRDDDLGKNGVFSISLRNNNGTFEISPTVGETRANFVVRVRNNSLLDYEKRHVLTFTIVAQEVGPKTSLSSSAQVTVYLNDANDNPPVFRESVYRVDLKENVTEGTKVVQVAADDIDEGENAEIAYIGIERDNNSLQIDSTGWISVRVNKHIFDREVAKDFHLHVLAADRNGRGNTATATLIITVLDVNDHEPKFEKLEYEFFLSKDLRSMTFPAFMKATDLDAEEPNNVVEYELLNGNMYNMFLLNKHTGELMVSKNNNYGSKGRSPYSEDYRIPTFKLLVRAYDLGIPQKSNAVPVTVYGPETNARNMTFILNGFPIEQKEAEAMLSKVTGGRVKIQEVRPYQTRQIRSSDDSEKTSSEKSIVEARVLYDDNPTVDLTQFQNALKNQSTVVVYKKEKVEEYHRAESALFWILMVLAILIVIIVILLLLCCICPGCPLYVNPKKGKQVDPHAEESVHLVVKEEGPGMETKAVQAEWMGHRREAWSADQRQQRYHSWRFNRRNIPTKEHDELYSTGLDDRRYGYDIQGPAAASLGARGHEDRHSLHSLPAQHVRVRDGPTVIYTRELQDLQRHADNRHRDTIYVEDIEGADYPPPGQIVDHRQARGHPHREVRINAEEDHDTDSIRRHEAERGSDLGRGGEYRRGEVHRDVDNEDREYRFVLRRGQRVKHSDGDEDDPQELSTAAPSRREQFYIRDGNAEILRLVTRGRSGDEQEFAQVGPQPEQRPMTLVPPRQQHHNGKEIIMQRFMEDQRNNSSQQGDGARAEEAAPDTALLTSLQQQDLLVRRLLEEEARLNNTLLLTEALVAQRQHEQYLATAGENMETQSLPGQALMATMATQTDVDSSTQTEPMHLMRPPRRRARSDNDDSYTEEEDKEGTTAEENASRLSLSGSAVHGLWIKKHRSKRKRSSLNRDLRLKRAGGKSLPVPGRRHKIKTPIMEETESALEAAERQSSAIPDHIPGGNYTENKTSLLRRRNNKAKVATSSGEMEVTSVPNPRQNGLEDVEEETPTDSLEERSPKKRKKYASDDNRGSGYRSHSPLRVSASTGDVRNVNFEDNRWPPPKRHHVEFQESDSSDKREMSDERRGSLSDKGRARASSYAASSDSTSGRPSELESSIEVKDNESQNLPERGRSSMRSSRSETGLNTLASGREDRRNSVPNDTKVEHRSRMSSRRGSLSEPGGIEQDILDLSQKQTIASRAKSLNQMNTVGKSNEVRRGSLSGPAPKRGSRYMEWYKTKKEERERRKREEDEAKKEKNKKKYKPGRVVATDTKIAKNIENEKRGSVKDDAGTKRVGEVDVDKELEKAEEQILKVTVFDDDMDSGIAMSSLLMGGGGKKKRSQHLMEKKSVFTIAYDDMQTKQLRPDSSSPKY